MKTFGWLKRRIILLTLLCSLASVVHVRGQTPPVGQDWLNNWSFYDTTNWYSDLGYAPVSFTNLTASDLGNGTALVLDSTNAAWLHYKKTESDGTNNLTVDRGSLMLWFSPSWSGTNEGGNG